MEKVAIQCKQKFSFGIIAGWLADIERVMQDKNSQSFVQYCSNIVKKYIDNTNILAKAIKQTYYGYAEMISKYTLQLCQEYCFKCYFMFQDHFHNIYPLYLNQMQD